jgi:hypothetical protein
MLPRACDQTPKYRPCLAYRQCDNFLFLQALHLRVLRKDEEITASFISSSCILPSKRFSFLIALSLPVEVTVTMADLLIDMSMPDAHRLPHHTSSHRAMTLEEVTLPPLAILAPLSDFVLFSTRNDRGAFRQHPFDHISLLSRCLSTTLAKACAYMS